MTQWLLEEACSTALELHEATLVEEEQERATRAGAVEKSQARREQARKLAAGG